MNAEQASQLASKARNKTRTNLAGKAGATIQVAASKGRNFVVCRSNKQACVRLKDDGFGCILLFNLALIWW